MRWSLLEGFRGTEKMSDICIGPNTSFGRRRVCDFQWRLISGVRMCVDATWKSYCICVVAAVTEWGFLSSTRLGASSSRVCLENLEALPVRRNFSGFHWSQKPEVSDEPERIKYETETLDGIAERLRLHHWIPPGKANVIADALSRKAGGRLAHLPVNYMENFIAFRGLNVDMQMNQRGALIATLKIRPVLIQHIQLLQSTDPALAKIIE